jgi:DNA/RNA endonuclease G (NUC1)
MTWITRQIRDFAPLTIIITLAVVTQKYWQPYFNPTSSIGVVTPSNSVHLALGNPSNAGKNPDNYLMVKPQYALSYNNSKGTPNWVSWELNKSYLGGVDLAC